MFGKGACTVAPTSGPIPYLRPADDPRVTNGVKREPGVNPGLFLKL